MFNHLITLERRVEAALQRKRAAATAALAVPQVAQRKIRLYLFSTHRGQQPSVDAAGGATCRVAMHGASCSVQTRHPTHYWTGSGCMPRSKAVCKRRSASLDAACLWSDHRPQPASSGTGPTGSACASSAAAEPLRAQLDRRAGP